MPHQLFVACSHRTRTKRIRERRRSHMPAAPFHVARQGVLSGAGIGEEGLQVLDQHCGAAPARNPGAGKRTSRTGGATSIGAIPPQPSANWNKRAKVNDSGANPGSVLIEKRRNSGVAPPFAAPAAARRGVKQRRFGRRRAAESSTSCVLCLILPCLPRLVGAESWAGGGGLRLFESLFDGRTSFDV